jgi:hypothetical protein
MFSFVFPSLLCIVDDWKEFASIHTEEDWKNHVGQSGEAREIGVAFLMTQIVL